MRTNRRIVLGIVVVVVLALFPITASADEPETICISSSAWETIAGLHARPTIARSRVGQRLTIPDRNIISIGYRVAREGNPVGDVILSIRDSATDEVIASKVWGNASQLLERGPASASPIVVEFASPVRVNGDVRICVEFYDGDAENHVLGGYRIGNVRDGEVYTTYFNNGVWHDIGDSTEGAYCYTYLVGDSPPTPPDDDKDDHDAANRTGPQGGGISLLPLIAILVAVAGIAGSLVAVRRNKRRVRKA